MLGCSPLSEQTIKSQAMPSSACCLCASGAATLLPLSAAASVLILEPAQYLSQASAFVGTDFCYGDVLLGTSNDVWKPD